MPRLSPIPSRLVALAVAALTLAGCSSGAPAPTAGEPGSRAPSVEWAIAIHGGAGVIERSLPADQQASYRDGLEEALRLGASVLEGGGTSLDAVEQVIRNLEDNPAFNAARGAVFNAAGANELDASIMRGSDLACGAVTGVTSVKNPISLARLVMEQTAHVLLAGNGAERFADETGVERVAPEYYFTEKRYRAWQRARGEIPDSGGGTVGAVALDRHGNLAAGTSTGGLTNKRLGRVGDTPIVGAGTYADNRSCAVSGTGKGEEFIRHGIARTIAALVAERGIGVAEAARVAIEDVLEPGDGGVIVVSPQGELALLYNTAGMYRGAADSAGRFEVAIWD